MLSSFRRMSKSTVGTLISVLFIGAIFASFAFADMNSLGTNRFSNSGSLATVGSASVTDRDLSRAMERRLAAARQEDPNATYAALAGDFDPMLDQLIQLRTLQAFADDYHFGLSKRLIDAEIANLPGARGLDGKVNDASYAAFLSQQRMTDAEVRDLIAASLRERLLLAPAVANARMPVGMATPYASMLLEERSGQIATIAADRFAAGINPTAAELGAFYQANKARYTIPEQRVLKIARITPEAVASVSASEAEIAAAYKAQADTYAAKDIRVITQAVVPSEQLAKAIADAARSGKPMADAVKPAGLSAADISVGPQTRSQFASLAGNAIAGQAFAAAQGAIIGPVKSDLGWHVIKIDAIRTEGGKSLAEVRETLAAKITADKRKEALIDLVTRTEDQIADGASLAEAAAAAKVPVETTPAVTAGGVVVGGGAALPEAMRPALKAGFDLQPDDDPVVETLPGDAGYLLVGVDRVIAAAPAPIASIQSQLRADFIQKAAGQRAAQAARQVADLTARGTPLADAVKKVGATLPSPEALTLRRMQLVQFGDRVPPPVRTLFALGQGKSRLVADPSGRAYFVVQATRIVPGNAATQPNLVTSTQGGLQAALGAEYAEQFVRAIGKSMGVKRDDAAIAETRKRIFSAGTPSE